MRMRLTHAAMACLLVLLGAGGAAAQVVQWEVDGETREAIVYPPSSPGEAAAPLVLAFHGFGDNMQNFQYTNILLPHNVRVNNGFCSFVQAASRFSALAGVVPCSRVGGAPSDGV